MKDLIVLTADADARGVMMGVLNRPHSLARFYQIPLEFIDNCILQFSSALKSEPDKIQRENPKELLQFFLHAIKRTMTPTHFKSIAAQASLRAWRASTSFSLMANILQQWFPPLENKEK